LAHQQSAELDPRLMRDGVLQKTILHHQYNHLEHKSFNNLMLRGLVRYGLRDYDQPFAYRDTQFFTVGSHFEWTMVVSVNSYKNSSSP
jgi:hypothetical protein